MKPFHLTALLAVLAPVSSAQITRSRDSVGHVDIVHVAHATGGGRFDLWKVVGGNTTGTSLIGNVRFLSLELVGYPIKDRLRLDLPSQRQIGGTTDWIGLPGGGGLYRVQLGSETALLHLRRDGSSRFVIRVTDVGPEPGIDQRVHVSPDGRWVLVSTPQGAGGDVYRVDLASRRAPESITASLPALGIEDRSLRVSAAAAWFLVDDTLYRATPASGWSASSVSLALVGEETVRREVVMSTSGDHLVLVSEEEDDERRLHVVTLTGGGTVVTPTPAEIALPENDHPLGPFVAIAPDGSRIAYKTSGASDELFVVDVDDVSRHLTQEPDFPVYIDNVGVLAFATANVLCFFGGDVQIGGADQDEMLAAAEMYAATFSGPPGTYTVINITHTNGQLYPPFDQSGTLRFSEAYVCPKAERFVLVGEQVEDVETVTCFRVNGIPFGQPNLQTLLTDLEEEPELLRAGEDVLIRTDDDDQDEPTELYVLRPDGPGSPVVDQLASFGAGVAIDRITTSPSGNLASFVTRTVSGDEVPYWVDLVAATSIPLTITGDPTSVSGGLVFSKTDNLYLGWGPDPTSLFFYALPEPGVAVRVNLPAGSGFPLQF